MSGYPSGADRVDSAAFARLGRRRRDHRAAAGCIRGDVDAPPARRRIFRHRLVRRLCNFSAVRPSIKTRGNRGHRWDVFLALIRTHASSASTRGGTAALGELAQGGGQPVDDRPAAAGRVGRFLSTIRTTVRVGGFGRPIRTRGRDPSRWWGGPTCVQGARSDRAAGAERSAVRPAILFSGIADRRGRQHDRDHHECGVRPQRCGCTRS